MDEQDNFFGAEDFEKLPDSFYKSLLHHLHDGIYLVNKDRKIMFWNKSAERLSGYSAEEVMGRFCGDRLLQHIDLNGKNLCGHGCPLKATIEDGNSRQANVFLKHKNGHRVPVQVSAHAVYDLTGKLIGAVESFIDITPHLDERRKIQELSKKANRDHLTGLFNRNALDVILGNLFNRWREDQSPFGVLFIDMDDLKVINDRFGHPVGDMAIQTVANSLAAYFRKDDIIARWGGDEFLVVLSDVDEFLIDVIAEKAETAISLAELPAEYGWKNLSISVGGAVIQPEDTIVSLIARADQLMYLKKKQKNARA